MVIEANFPDAIRRFILDENKSVLKNTIVVFTHLHSNESLAAATEIAKLSHFASQAMKLQTIRADCLYDLEICDLLLSHTAEFKKHNLTLFPLVTFVTKEKIYKWKGPVEAETIMKKFLENKNYLKFESLGGGSTRQVVDSGSDYIR